jgi:hypothetical protein
VDILCFLLFKLQTTWCFSYEKWNKRKVAKAGIVDNLVVSRQQVCKLMLLGYFHAVLSLQAFSTPGEGVFAT